MPLLVYQDQAQLVFGITEDVARLIEAWQRNLDEYVMNEQIETGSFHGKFSIDGHLREGVKQMRAEGEVFAYYGAIAGAYVLAFQVDLAESSITVRNTVVEDSTNIHARVIGVSTHEEVLQTIGKGCLFAIQGQAHKNLTDWPGWDAFEALSARYRYEFTPTTIGTFIRVYDLQTDEKRDIPVCNW